LAGFTGYKSTIYKKRLKKYIEVEESGESLKILVQTSTKC